MTIVAPAPAAGTEASLPTALPIRLSYVSGPSTAPLIGPTIRGNLDAAGARYPDNDALVVRPQNNRYSYRQLHAAVDECARALLACGIQKGDRVGIWAPNLAEWPITQFATAKIGAILVNINPAYRLTELDYAL